MPIPDECLTHSVSPLDIKRLAMHDPIVLACYRAWESGALTWDQALMHAVAALARANRELVQMRAPEPRSRYDAGEVRRRLDRLSDGQIDALHLILSQTGVAYIQLTRPAEALPTVLPGDRVTVRYGNGEAAVERCVGIFEDTRKEYENGQRL